MTLQSKIGTVKVDLPETVELGTDPNGPKHKCGFVLGSHACRLRHAKAKIRRRGLAGQ